MVTLQKTSEGVKTFCLHSMFGGKLVVGAPDDNSGEGHALPSFGPLYLSE